MKRLSSSSAATATSRGIKLDDDAVKLIAWLGAAHPGLPHPAVEEGCREALRMGTPDGG